MQQSEGSKQSRYGLICINKWVINVQWCHTPVTCPTMWVNQMSMEVIMCTCFMRELLSFKERRFNPVVSDDFTHHEIQVVWMYVCMTQWKIFPIYLDDTTITMCSWYGNTLFVDNFVKSNGRGSLSGVEGHKLYLSSMESARIPRLVCLP